MCMARKVWVQEPEGRERLRGTRSNVSERRWLSQEGDQTDCESGHIHKRGELTWPVGEGEWALSDAGQAATISNYATIHRRALIDSSLAKTGS